MVSTPKDPAFLFYAGTWMTSDEVSCLTLEQQGAYVRLLCFAWLHGSIPASEVEIRGLLGLLSASDEVFARVWSPMLSRCWVRLPGTPGRLINQRLEHERAERHRKAAEMRARGQAGGQRSAEQRASGDPSRGSSRGQPEPQAEGQAGGKPSTSTSTARMDGRMDGGSSVSQNQKGEGVSTPRGGSQLAGDVAGSVLRKVAQ
ncbi:MAG: hypothetical protein RJA36_792 [Pseudomonadota bacterium]|jgi:uncharacterized protein YdaU (DUF1376 family)